jgi:hypothetical protein
MSVVSVAVLAFLIAVITGGVALLAAMYVKNKPFYGAMGLCLLSGPGSILTFVYVVVSAA